VIQQRENLLKVLTEASIKDFDIILRRLFLLVSDACEDFVSGAVKRNKYLVETLEEKHNTINKFMANGLRLLNKVGHPNYKNTSLYYHIIECLDNINDALKESARDISNLDIKVSKNCENILNRINESFKDYHKFFYKFDFKLLGKINKDRYEILEDIRRLSKKMSKDELILVTSMERVIEQIIDMREPRIAMQY